MHHYDVPSDGLPALILRGSYIYKVAALAYSGSLVEEHGR